MTMSAPQDFTWGKNLTTDRIGQIRMIVFQLERVFLHLYVNDSSIVCIQDTLFLRCCVASVKTCLLRQYHIYYPCNLTSAR